jgi:hypothetical protein
MEWPTEVQLSEIQSRLIMDGVPVDRAMHDTSAIGQLRHGGRYKVERAQGDLFLYALGAGWYHVADE